MATPDKSDNITKFFDYSLYLPTRTIYMGSVVDESMAEYFIKAMSILSATDGQINVHMNNQGGDEYHGLAIYDSITTCPHRVVITVYGHAMSMGSWILQAADERVMTPHSTLMIHYGEWGKSDHFKYMEVEYLEGVRINGLMEVAYLERIREAQPSFTQRKLKKMLMDETYLPADEAVELGLADRILPTA